MPDFCTCGAELPPDAWFCHKCGKPQREELLPAPVEEPAAPPPPAPIAPAPVRPAIGFRNPLAFRIGFFAALVSLLLNLLLFEACPIWLVAAGFLGVYLYHRRSGESITVRGGAKMGWLTGLLAFFLFSLPFTFGFLSAVRQPDFSNRMRDQMSRYPFPPETLDQMLATLQTPLGLATQILTALVVLFVLFTLFPLIGGALGAKVLGKD
ncbi:MAG: zinc ribbon domain-containing protein [Acidobacteriota bacterium]